MKKRICLGIGLLLVLLLAGCQSVETEQPLEYYSRENNEASYTLENDRLQLVMEGETSHFTLTDRKTGEQWTSMPQGAAEDPGADPDTRYTMQAPLVLTYSDKTGNTINYDAYRYALKDGTFQIRREADGLWVDYMIGPSQRVYIVPEVISAERLDEMTSRMESADRGVVLRLYRKFDLAKVKDEKDAQELLEQIPILEEGPAYALANATGGSAPQRYQMEQLEAAFASVGYTEEEAEQDRSLLSQETNLIQFNLSIHYYLEGDALVVEVPTEKISYPAEYPVESIRVLPYFCAAAPEDQGYFLVPDGGGGQIFFHNGKTRQNAYYASIYGWDEAHAREQRVQDPDAAYPVFGMARNGRSLLAVAEGGAAEMAVEADVCGKWSSYDYICPIFRVVHGEDTSASAKSHVTVRVFQGSHPSEVLTLRYFPGETDSYVDMANRYRVYLQENNPQFTENGETGTPLVLEFIGAIDQTEKILGFPTRQVVAAADYREVTQALAALPETENLRVVYSGAVSGGLDQNALGKAKPVSALGSDRERKALLEAVAQAGGKLYLNAYAEQVMHTGLFDGFSSMGDTIRTTANTVVERYPYWQDTQLETETGDDLVYLQNAFRIRQGIQALAAEAGRWNAGVGLADVGDLLYSDFNRERGCSRDQMRREQRSQLAELADLLVAGGNDYAAVSADCILGLDLNGGGYDLVDRQIPFYPIVLHGSVSYTGDPLNLTGDPQRELLRSLEYGAGLSYRFFEADYADLQDSKYTYQNRLYSANFSDWQEDLAALYSRVDRELGHTFSQTIADHRYLADQVTLTVYADGTRVYVNYGLEPYEEAGITVPPEDWYVEKGGVS